MASGSDSPGAGEQGVDTAQFIRVLFDGLSTADHRLIRHAGYIICETAHQNDDLRGPIVRGLTEWVVRQHHQESVLRTLATLQRKYDGTVREALLAATGRREAGLLYERLTSIRPWQLSFDSEEAEGEGDTLIDVGGPGKVRVPREFLARYSKSRGYDEKDEKETVENPHLETESPTQKRNWSHWARLKKIEDMPHGETFAVIEEVSRFDEFQFLGPEVETRYSHSVPIRTLEGTQEDIAITRLYRQHEAGGFQKALATQLQSWDLADIPGVVDLADWGDSPRPWVIATHTDQTAWERGKVPPAEALRIARTLTGTLAELHGKDIIHGGIDPHSIRYTPSMFQTQAEPLIDNVGLIPIYRQFDSPASYTDPRYAAPEYFTTQHGNISPASDLYQLGMTIYSLFTGDPPYSGSIAEIRRQVLTDTPIGLSHSNPDLPGAIPEILGKATARQKIARYETATQFHSAICRACDRLLEE